MKLQDAQHDTNDDILANQTVTNPKKPYGNDTLSASEMANGLTRPARRNAVSQVTDYMADEQQTLSAKEKFALIL